MPASGACVPREETREEERNHRVGEIIDAVLARYALGVWEEEVVRAREEWLARAGRVYDDERSFEYRLSNFQEWYAIHRPLKGGEVPVVRYLVEERPRLEACDAACLAALCRAQWSLYRVLRREEGMVSLFDMLRGGRFDVAVAPSLPGFEPGDVFEARIIGFGGSLRFTRAFLFHPVEAARSIEAYVGVALGRGESADTILFRLAQARLRCDRYRNIAADRIYEQALLRQRTEGGGQ